MGGLDPPIFGFRRTASKAWILATSARMKMLVVEEVAKAGRPPALGASNASIRLIFINDISLKD
jgi:hypothetical protein